MAVYRSFSLYVGASPSGVTVVNQAVNGTGIMICTSNDHEINAGPNIQSILSVMSAGQRRDWWMSPMIDDRYKIWIAHPNGTAGGGNYQPLPEGVTAVWNSPSGGIGYWGVNLGPSDNYTQGYINLCNWAYLQVEGVAGSFTTGTAGRAWVRANGFWDNYGTTDSCNQNASFALSPPNGINW